MCERERVCVCMSVCVCERECVHERECVREVTPHSCLQRLTDVVEAGIEH